MVWSSWLIVTFVDKRRSLVFKSILVGCIAPNRHQYHRVIPAYTKVHPLLKARSLTSAHVNIRNNVIAQ
jgi:hypothetical protein